MHDGNDGATQTRRRILAGRAFIDDDGVAAPGLAAFLAAGAPLEPRGAVELAPSDDARALTGKLVGVDLVVVRFAKGSEGRPYTQARILREELGYRGRIRAVGAVLVDSIGFMRRCGIDQMILRDKSDEAFALAVLDRFTVFYQGAADVSLPLFRRVSR